MTAAIWSITPRKGARRFDLFNWAKKGRARKVAKSNRPSTAHTEHTAPWPVSGSGRARTGRWHRHEDIHGLANAVSDEPGNWTGCWRWSRAVEKRRADGGDQLLSIDDRKVKQKFRALAAKGVRRFLRNTRCSQATGKRHRRTRPRASAKLRALERDYRTPAL